VKHLQKVTYQTKKGLAIIVMVFMTLKGACQINADFSSANLSACNTLQTTFFDQSTSAESIIDWSWDLNVNTSLEQNPGALFTEPGSFTICLTVTDVNGNSDTECKEDYVTVFPNPVADFTIDNIEGCVPVLVNFSDNSSSQNGDIISYLWDVGGSAGVLSQSSPSDFSSTYSIQGSYSASLTVIDEKGCTTTTTKPNAVVASALTNPDVKIELIPSCDLPWEINFSNQNADPLISYTWDFGNGEIYQGLQPPTITYTELGVYDITIYMASGECKDTIVLKNFVDTYSSAAFDFSPSVICQSSEVQFTDLSFNDAEEVIWVFGDGFTSTESNPIHIYDSSGCFNVSLIRTVGGCIDTVTFSCLEVLELPTVTYDITNQYECSLPADVLLHAESESVGDISWQFIENNNITDYNTNDVSFSINEYGSYFAVLTFAAETGCTVIIDSIPIEIAPLEVNMPILEIGGCAPLTFTLMDSISSNVAITSYQWSIGNPTIYTSSSSTPTFTIPDTGSYDLQLIAENIYGCIDTVYLEDYINVGDNPIVDFVAFPVEGCVDVDKFFTDLSSENADEWEWFFGNDGYSVEQNPVFNFADPGIYDVALYASHNGCTDSIRFQDYITIFEPVSKFVIDYNCEDPYTVNINNRSIGADSLLWTLYLSETDSITFTDSILGNYTFPDRGNYPITLYSKSFDTGCDHLKEDTIRIVDPIASYAVDTLRGCAPFSIEIGNFSQDAFSYEFISDVANIDSIFSEEPIVTFLEGGILNGPLLIITDIHECKDSFQLFDSIQVNKLDANIGYTEVICVPDVAEFNDESTADLANIISWEWVIEPIGFISNDKNTSLYIDSVGLYDLEFKVEDDWGCIDSISITQAILAVEVIPDFTYDSLSCSWAPINFSPSGENGNMVTYFWEFGDGNTSDLKTPSYTYSAEGVYSVCLTMTDIRGCDKTICKDNIVNISNPVAYYTGDPLEATCPPLLTNFENQSTNAFTYIWDFGDNSGKSTSKSPSHVYTSPGRFDVTLIATSTPSCIDTLFLPEYVKVEGPKGDFEADIAPTCLPVSVTLNANSDGYYSYVWDLGNGILDSVEGLVITDVISYEYTQPGRYTPKLIITDSVGCTRSFAGDPIELDLVTLDFTMESDPICGPPLTISLENLSIGTTEDVDYLWQISGIDTYQSVEENPSFDIQQTGQYNVNLIAQYGNCTDTLSIPDFLEVADIPEVSFEIETEELCEDVNVTFVNNSTVDYGEFSSWIWDFGDGSFSTEENPTHQYEGLESQTITLVGITDKGCEATYSSSFEVLPSTIATVEDDKLICIGDEVQISGAIENLQPNGTFYWENEASLSCTDCLSPIATPLITTTYILVGVHPNGCESRDTIEVVVIPTPGPELALQSEEIICLGNETVIDVLNFNQSFNYQWNTSILGQDCYINCETVHVSPEEETTYYVTVFNEFGCFKNDSITIDVETSIEDFLPEETAICFGDETTIGISGGNDPLWGIDAELNCLTCPENTVSPLHSTIYNVVVQSDLGCFYEDSISVVVVPTNSADVGEVEEICVGESVLLTSIGFGAPLWTANIPLDIDDEPTIIVSPDETQYFYLNMTYYECSQMDSVLVTVHKKANIEVVGDTICVGETAIVSANGRADGYQWTIDDEIETKKIVNVKPEYTTQYPVIASYRTCTPDSAVATVYVHPHIDYKIEEDFYNIYLNDQVNILPEYDIGRNYSFDWLPPDGLDCFDCPNPIIKGITESIDYNVLVVDEETGCEINQDISVRFNNECTNMIFHLPNIFSPNNDGVNDEWRMYTNNPEEFISISVFDRYGNFIFYTNDINETWDGKYNGQDVTLGVYVYKVRLTCPYNRKEYYILGDVTILR
jgi:gliding motility-associated-like protein